MNNLNKVMLFKKLAKRKLYIYNLYFFSYFFALGVFLPLFPIYMREVAKLSDDKIGIIMSFIMLIAIIFQPFWGIIYEKFRLDKKIVLLSLVMMNISVFLIMTNKLFLLIGISTIIFGLFSCGIGPIQDSLAVIFTKKYNFKYGDVRIWGSIGYALATLFTGYLVKTYGYNIIIILSTVFYLIAFFSFFRIKQVRPIVINKSNKRENNILLVLKNKVFIIFLVFASLGIGVFCASGNYMVLQINKMGGDTTQIGLFTSITVFIEIITMYYVIKINNSISEFRLLIFSIIIQIPVFLVYILSKDFYILLYVLPLRGITSGLFVPIVVNFISSLLPNEQLSSGIILYSALSINLTGYIITICSGFITKFYSYTLLFIITLIIVSISLIFAFILNKLRKPNVKRL